ncbi:MAG: flagellum-specific ATP synthase FliI, partial [Bradyrhizobium sp.]
MTLQSLVSDLAQIPEHRRYGRVTAVLGMLLEIGGVPESLAVGGRCEIIGRYGSRLPCEVVGFRNGRALLMPFGSIDGIGLGCKAEVANSAPVVYPHEGWLGRVVNALGEPIDG